MYRVGIIGHTGRGNYGHGLDRVWRDVPETTVVAVADADESGRGQARQRTGAERAYADYRQMLDDEELDIVAVAPRHLDQHRDMTLACAEHHCHVYMEKPFCRTLEEADEIVQAFEMRHLKLAIAHQTRYSPVLDVVQQEIAGGLIGDVLELRARGKEDARRGGGEDLWVLGSHMMDLMRVFAGDPHSCYAVVFENGERITAEHVQPGNEGIGPLAGDAINAMYLFDEQRTGYFGSHRTAAGNPSRFGLQIFGTQGIAEIYSGYLAPAAVLRDSSWSPARSGKQWESITSAGVGRPEPLERTGLHGGNVRAVKDLIAAIENDSQPKCSMYDARWTVEMIAAVFDSTRIGSPVTFPLQTRQNPLKLLP